MLDELERPARPEHLRKPRCSTGCAALQTLGAIVDELERTAADAPAEKSVGR